MKYIKKTFFYSHNLSENEFNVWDNAEEFPNYENICKYKLEDILNIISEQNRFVTENTSKKENEINSFSVELKEFYYYYRAWELDREAHDFLQPQFDWFVENTPYKKKLNAIYKQYKNSDIKHRNGTVEKRTSDEVKRFCVQYCFNKKIKKISEIRNKYNLDFKFIPDEELEEIKEYYLSHKEKYDEIINAEEEKRNKVNADIKKQENEALSKIKNHLCISLLNEETHQLINRQKEIQELLSKGFEPVNLDKNMSCLFFKVPDNYIILEEDREFFLSLLDFEPVYKNKWDRWA